MRYSRIAIAPDCAPAPTALHARGAVHMAAPLLLSAGKSAPPGVFSSDYLSVFVSIPKPLVSSVMVTRSESSSFGIVTDFDVS